MTTIRSCSPADISKLNLCNLDPLTENYARKFYFDYLAKWPTMFIVAENQKGQIVAYVMGKVEEDPDYLKILGDNYLPWHGHVTALTVAPQYRQMGLAKQLTAQLDRACEQENAWFMDLFVRVSNKTAISMYKKMGYVMVPLPNDSGLVCPTGPNSSCSYSVYRRVVSYYSDDPTGKGTSEDAFDMRKSLPRDRHRRYVRENGENHRINPEDLYHG
ncbi:MAG: hypothetical protein L6R35_000455 [Caloplaca aegaea]|nr:MAG: hypothetical protein L6R35_000455 [Caloplaca aegaea]